MNQFAKLRYAFYLTETGDWIRHGGRPSPINPPDHVGITPSPPRPVSPNGMTDSNASDPSERTDPERANDEWATRVWTAGEYERIAPYYRPMAGDLVDRLAPESDESVLDVGCGTGNAAITAGRTGATVTGIDITPALLERARVTASRAGVDDITWLDGDAISLPVPDNAFDITLSTLGHMYADPPDAAASELVRVTRPGGRIGYTAWTPTSCYPRMASALLAYLDPDDVPSFSSPPFMWGDEGTAEARLGEHLSPLTFERATVDVPTLSPAHFWETTRRTSGVFSSLVETVPAGDRPDLGDDMVDRIEPSFDHRRNVVELEYLIVTGTLDP